MKIAIIEDNTSDYATICELIKRYSKEKNLEITTVYFEDAFDFLDRYSNVYDAVFMDIDLPMLNGMDAAKKLRAQDKVVPIVFITNLQHYAIEGYSVNAISYLLKPVTYPQAETVLNKLLRKMQSTEKKDLMISSAGGGYCVNMNDVIYVTVIGDHKLEYYVNGEERPIIASGSMKKAEEAFPKKQFCKANSGTLVNLNFVKLVKQNDVDVGVAILALSRPQKKKFISALNEWIGV